MAGPDQSSPSSNAAADGLPKDASLSTLLEQNSFFDSPEKINAKKSKLAPIIAHLNPRDLKALFKSSLAVWIMTLFILIDPLLRAEGQAAFFGCLMMFIAPPSGILFVQLMAGLTVLVGMAMGWAWGVITMKAALAARPQHETNVRLFQLRQEATRNATNVGQLSGQTTYAQILIFEGFMLDARVTAVYFCMLCLFIYLLARFRVRAPKFTMIQMFGTIIADIFLTSGPLLPSFVGTIPQTLVKPAATAVAIGIACNVLFFPESTSHVLLADVKVLLGSMTEFVDACRLSFDNNAGPMSPVRLQQAKAACIAKYKGLDAPYTFLPLDMSIGRWNAQDIALLRKPLRGVFATWAALLESQITRTQSQALYKQFEEREESRRKGQEVKEEKPQFGRHQLAQQLDFARLYRNPGTEDLIVKSMAALQETSDPILISCKKSIEAIIETLALVNERKFYSRLSADTWAVAHQRHGEALEKLRTDCKDFMARTPSRLFDPHAHFFDENGHLNLPPNSGVAPLRGVLLGLIFQERIVSFAHAVEQLLAQTIALEEQRTRIRLWLPTGLRHLGSWAFSRQPAPQIAPASPEFEEEQKKFKPKHRRTRGKKHDENLEQQHLRTTTGQLKSIHLHRGKERSRTSRILLGIIYWISNTEGMFAFRVLIITIALAIPAVIPSSAGFFYREKGLWALLMAQITLVPYTADFIWSLLLRLVGTVLGGIIGMIAWYIGAGNGPGNAYGMAAIMAPIIVVLMFGRLFGPPAFIPAFILTSATVYLVMAYSWADTHVPSYGNPGVGYQVFWRRALLVIIGFVGAAIVMYFPRPPSAGRHYRRVLAATLSRFKDLYALYITAMTGHGGHATNDPDLTATIEKNALGTAEALASIMGPIQLLRFEFSSTDFTASGLSRITALATKANFNLYQLFYYSSQLPDDFRKQFTSLSAFFEEHFIGDFMAVLTLLGHSLATGEALPSVLSAPLVVRAFRDHPNRLRTTTDVSSRTHIAPEGDEKSHPVQDVLGVVTRQQIVDNSDGFRKFCVALTSSAGLLNAIDEMVLVVKEELGESHVVDIENWGTDIYSGSGTQWLMDEKNTER